ncbi:hypothetical protein DF057_13745 [Burkholderia cepacia]|uniref:hypothetical protein n=1 Tax=Burkholderia cepacia TaxID=292 RepID=UPI000F5FEC1E|nr:hypothetical protein [Burkholderia cepacia]RQZ61172.1 hypothetical protein DF057_13745 [Burkholderia cepacia]
MEIPSLDQFDSQCERHNEYGAEVPWFHVEAGFDNTRRCLRPIRKLRYAIRTNRDIPHSAQEKLGRALPHMVLTARRQPFVTK